MLTAVSVATTGVTVEAAAGAAGRWEVTKASARLAPTNPATMIAIFVFIIKFPEILSQTDCSP